MVILIEFHRGKDSQYIGCDAEYYIIMFSTLDVFEKNMIKMRCIVTVYKTMTWVPSRTGGSPVFIVIPDD